ncbi:MAG: MerR family transcriptional regulator [Verrucomicrobiae bacterium]|nr:MerR family transcriptional regulator [Verrucomicrobiae bacterium]MDW8309518.1 MerR family transcriptional regulator [Verrucomicrobiales bacterium]
MNPNNIERNFLLQLYEPDAHLLYTLEEAARLAHVPRRWIAIYYLHGLVAPVMDPDSGGWFFNDEAIRRLRRVEQLRQAHGVSLPIIRLVLELEAEIERLQRELRFWRGF